MPGGREDLPEEDPLLSGEDSVRRDLHTCDSYRLPSEQAVERHGRLQAKFRARSGISRDLVILRP